MIHNTKNTFGNDKHCVMYISAEETLEGVSFIDSSYVANDFFVDSVTRETTPSPRFGDYSYYWGSSSGEESSRGISGETKSEYIFGTKDFAIDTWFKFVDPGTYGNSDIFAIADSEDPSNNYLLLQAYAPSAVTNTVMWYFYIRNNGSYILAFQRQQSSKFQYGSWYHFNFSRKNIRENEDSYSFYIGNTSERHSYWFTGVTTTDQDYNWGKPIIYIGKSTNGILPEGSSSPLMNTYLDTIRLSVGKARKWSNDNTVSSGSEFDRSPKKPVYFTPNRSY